MEPAEIRIVGLARTIEEEEGLQLALTILQMNQRVRASPHFRPRAGAMRRP